MEETRAPFSDENEGLRRELRRTRVLAGLLREAHRLCAQDLPATQIPQRLLRVLMAGFGADRGVLLRVLLPGAAAELRYSVGMNDEDLSGLMVPAALGDYWISGDPVDANGECTMLIDLMARTHLLWARNPGSGSAVLLGSDGPLGSSPFDRGDRPVVEEFLNLYQELVERRLQIRMLRDSEERFRGFVENMGDGAFRADREGLLTFANQVAMEVIGIPEEELIGMSFLQLFHDEDRSRLLEIHRRIIGGEGAQDEVQFINGVLAHVVAEPLRDPGGEVVGVFGTFRDVTDRRHIEETLRNLVEHSLQGLIIIQGGQLVYANPMVAEMLGSSVQSLTGQQAKNMLSIVHPEDRDLVWSRFQQRLEGENPPPRYNFRMLRGAGEVITVQMYATRTVFEGRPAIQVALLDVSDQAAGC